MAMLIHSCIEQMDGKDTSEVLTMLADRVVGEINLIVCSARSAQGRKESDGYEIDGWICNLFLCSSTRRR